MEIQSFLKEELYSIIPDNPKNLEAEWMGIIHGLGVLQKSNDQFHLLFTHQDIALIKKIVTIQKKVQGGLSNYQIFALDKKGLNKGKFYQVDFELGKKWEMLQVSLARSTDSLREAGFHFLRGLFETKGYLGEPHRSYQLEMRLSSEKVCDEALGFLQKQNLDFKKRLYRNRLILYSKNINTITSFVHSIGATHTYLILEKLVAEKATFNELTRWVNCETSNLERTVAYSMRLREKLQKIDLETLPPKLFEIALLRIKHPLASLKELGKLCRPPISKGEAHRRLKTIEKMVESKSLHIK